MSATLDDRQLATLAFPADDDTLSDADVLMGSGQADDLAALFRQIRVS